MEQLQKTGIQNYFYNENSDELQLSPIELKEEYRKKWNVNVDDFVVLTRNGKLINDSLYRLGGMGKKPDGKNYFMLLKYVEAYYSDDIMKISNSTDNKHLEYRSCIFDKNGIEKIEFESFKIPYLFKNSCIYSIERNYYNIETGEFYCHAYNSMESLEFLFLENSYDKNHSKRGIMKINKKDGTWILFK